IRNGRHPLLVGGDEVVVPFDLVLAPDELTILVSGPNTGGKTVLIKAVGLICLMAQSGIIPPLGPQSALPVFDAVFADIGDRQSIAASLSTFSAHVAALRDLPEAEVGLDALLAAVEAGARELEAREQELATRDAALREDATRVDARADQVAQREREVKARAQTLEREAREQTRAYLLEARRKVEEALGRARAAVDEATAREARRLLERAIEETAGEGGTGKPEGWVSLDQLRRQREEAGAPRRPPSPARPPAGAGRPAPMTTAATEVSLIGLRVADAEPLLARALDDAV